MMVSTRRTTGLTVVSRVRLSPEIVSSPSSSSLATCNVNASVACSRTRCDCSVRFSKSAICRGVDFDGKLLAQQQRKLIAHLHLAGISGSDGQHVVVSLQWHEVVTEHQVRGNGPEEFGIDALFPEVDERIAVSLRQLPGRFPLLLLVRRRGGPRDDVGMFGGCHESLSCHSRRGEREDGQVQRY